MEEVKIGSMVDKYGYHMELWRKFLVEVDSDYGWFDSGLGWVPTTEWLVEAIRIMLGWKEFWNLVVCEWAIVFNSRSPHQLLILVFNKEEIEVSIHLWHA